MESKHLLQISLGAFSLILAVLLLQGFNINVMDPITASVTLLIAFFLIFITAVLWIATAVSLSREI